MWIIGDKALRIFPAKIDLTCNIFTYRGLPPSSIKRSGFMKLAIWSAPTSQDILLTECYQKLAMYNYPIGSCKQNSLTQSTHLQI